MRRIFTILFSVMLCCSTVDAQLIITGVYDGPLPGGSPKGVELYVTEDIADLSVWGLGSANNGGGTDSVEYSFPAISASMGDYIYVTNDSLQFVAFFGFSPLNESGAMAINGDDAIELFNNGQVVDIYGDINVDGTGEPWEYLDGWAVRNAGTGPDGSTFAPSNWTYSGVDQLEGGMTNETCVQPFPLASYTGGLPADVTVEARPNRSFAPADITIDVGDVVEWINAGGFHNVNGSQQAYPDNPEGFSNGPASSDAWTYRYTFTLPGVYTYHCDPHVGSGMVGTVTVMGEQTSYPPYPIPVVTTEDENGVADSLGVTCQIEGRVYGPNLRPNGLQITIIDGDNNGIGLFTASDQFGSYSEGDVIQVRGTISQFNGLTQITPDEIEPLFQNMPPVEPLVVTGPLGEDTESKLILIEDLIVDEVGNSGNSGFNLRMSNANGEYNIRVDADTDIEHSMFEVGQRYHVTGIGGQFDTSDPRTDGYQIGPRFTTDFELVTSVQNVDWSQEVLVYPTPVSDWLYVDTQLDIDRVRISDQNGKILQQWYDIATSNQYDVSDYPAGVYYITFAKGTSQWVTRFVKK